MELIGSTMEVNNKNSITVVAYYRPPDKTAEAYFSKTDEKTSFSLEVSSTHPTLDWITLQVEGNLYLIMLTSVS